MSGSGAQKKRQLPWPLMVLAIGLGIVAWLVIAFSLVLTALAWLPWVARLLVGFFIIVLLSAGIGAAVDATRRDMRWLWALLGGLVVAASPLLMLAVHGSWDAQYEVPGYRGRILTYHVSWYGVVALLSGLALMAAGAVMRLRVYSRKRE